MSRRIVRVVCASDGRTPTPHDGRYVVAWNPHVPAGDLAVDSTDDPAKARRFENSDEFVEWKTVSRVEPRRPWDGLPNRPLTGITIQSIDV